MKLRCSLVYFSQPPNSLCFAPNIFCYYSKYYLIVQRKIIDESFWGGWIRFIHVKFPEIKEKVKKVHFIQILIVGLWVIILCWFGAIFWHLYLAEKYEKCAMKIVVNVSQFCNVFWVIFIQEIHINFDTLVSCNVHCSSFDFSIAKEHFGLNFTILGTLFVSSSQRQ